MISKYITKFSNAMNGLKYALFSDLGFRTQIYLGIFVAFVVLVFLLPITQNEFLFIILGYILVIVTELQNSALESALDKVHPELHNSIKHSKDMAAAAVLMAGVFLLIVLLSIAYSRF